MVSSRRTGSRASMHSITVVEASLLAPVKVVASLGFVNENKARLAAGKPLLIGEAKGRNSSPPGEMGDKECESNISESRASPPFLPSWLTLKGVHSPHGDDERKSPQCNQEPALRPPLASPVSPPWMDQIRAIRTPRNSQKSCVNAPWTLDDFAEVMLRKQDAAGRFPKREREEELIGGKHHLLFRWVMISSKILSATSCPLPWKASPATVVWSAPPPSTTEAGAYDRISEPMPRLKCSYTAKERREMQATLAQQHVAKSLTDKAGMRRAAEALVKALNSAEGRALLDKAAAAEAASQASTARSGSSSTARSGSSTSSVTPPEKTKNWLGDRTIGAINAWGRHSSAKSKYASNLSSVHEVAKGGLDLERLLISLPPSGGGDGGDGGSSSSSSNAATPDGTPESSPRLDPLVERAAGSQLANHILGIRARYSKQVGGAVREGGGADADSNRMRRRGDQVTDRRSVMVHKH